jgi:hypothetical protein
MGGPMHRSLRVRPHWRVDMSYSYRYECRRFDTKSYADIGHGHGRSLRPRYCP